MEYLTATTLEANLQWNLLESEQNNCEYVAKGVKHMCLMTIPI